MTVSGRGAKRGIALPLSDHDLEELRQLRDQLDAIRAEMRAAGQIP